MISPDTHKPTTPTDEAELPPLRVALVSLDDGPPGHDGPDAPPALHSAGSHVAALATSMAKAGHTVTVYVRADDPKQEPVTKVAARLTVVRLPAGPPRELAPDDVVEHLGEFGSHLAAQWTRRRPDVVHAHYWSAGIAAALAAREAKVPVVQTFQALSAPTDTGVPAQRSKLERLVGREAVRVAATSSVEADELIRRGIPRSMISIVPCGVDPEHFTPDGPVAERGAAHRLVCVGDLVPHKGFDTVIHALRALPETELVLVGGMRTGPEARRLFALARAEGVADRFHLTGPLPDGELPALLRSADALVCCPAEEPFGLTVSAAMACETAVVASEVGVLADLVIDGVTGRLVPPEDPEALAKVLAHVLADPVTAQSYGAAGRDRVRARYSWDRVAEDTVRLYRQAVAEFV
ncbi:glycosyltransferase [Allokutzneria sp. A3M-2-11 16]|uniref:glycosyltransferase n=1 Tax=Allokutzneria sp. A3M-2-11 16 TaxID=2962043 RepID=UPI0020B84EBC|nr:glycosyltransferase [Allokutzneria sp. A3M-2-11 16]MCP3797647.1 glycosyltransferase [Allokutzneria sp. A3M-2-11 16]